jgi:hypothetical protein
MRALSCALLCALLRGQEAWDCPEVGCGYLGANATYTGRYAVFMAGRIRVAHAALQKLRPIIERRYSGAVRVDFFFHVWVNKTSLCERRTLDEFKALATAITVEPVECMWSWGTGGSANSFQNQWHGVDLAFQTLERFGRAEDYTLILKSRVDVSYSDLDLEALWRRYGNSSSAQAAGGHFAVLAISQGWDVHAAATPPLARAFAAYRRGSGFGCDSRSDSFPWQRFARHGCWMPPGDAAQGPGCGRGTKKGVDPRCTGAIAGQATPKHVRGRPPRCAPLFVDWIPSSIHRSHPYALNPDTEPRLGCVGRRRRRLTSAPRRRLGASMPREWVKPPKSWCAAHRHDVFYVSPAARCPRCNHVRARVAAAENATLARDGPAGWHLW